MFNSYVSHSQMVSTLFFVNHLYPHILPSYLISSICICIIQRKGYYQQYMTIYYQYITRVFPMFSTIPTTAPPIHARHGTAPGVPRRSWSSTARAPRSPAAPRPRAAARGPGGAGWCRGTGHPESHPCRSSWLTWDTLQWFNITMENHHWNSGFTH